jgi:DNA-directed RNA polymerase subunit RPC12/RpoP
MTKVYRCQFCGEESESTEWGEDDQTCPNCGRRYDWQLAQDSEE